MIVYSITNKINGKVYIGQTIKKRVSDRWSGHKWALNNNCHANSHLQRAWNLSSGKDDWKVSIISTANSLEELNIMEEHCIANAKSCDPKFGYNLRAGGKNSKMSADSVAKMKLSWTDTRREETSKRYKEMWKDDNFRVQAKIRWNKQAAKLAGTYAGFISPDSEIFSPVVNLNKFCREHNLMLGHMQEIDKGDRKTHRGWKKYND